MEMVARKKKHHLELEEMVEHDRMANDRPDRQKEVSRDLRNVLVAAEEEKISQKEDAVFDKRQQMIESALEEQKKLSAEEVSATEEAVSDCTDEMSAELNAMLSGFAEEELEELEKAMGVLEVIEVVDPHMSEEDLEELKRRHRTSEQKAMMKADMDYLKGIMKLLQAEGYIGKGLFGIADTGMSVAGNMSGSGHTGITLTDSLSMQGCGGTIDLQG
jgi:hypothetical protein